MIFKLKLASFSACSEKYLTLLLKTKQWIIFNDYKLFLFTLPLLKQNLYHNINY